MPPRWLGKARSLSSQGVNWSGGYERLLCGTAEQTLAWHQHWEFGMERRLAAIMVADIVGYSSLMEDAEEQTADEVARCQELIREKVSPSVEESSTRQVTLAWRSSAAPSMPCAARPKSATRWPAAPMAIR